MLEARDEFVQLLCLVRREYQVVPVPRRLDPHREGVQVSAREAPDAGVQVAIEALDGARDEAQLLAVQTVACGRFAVEGGAPVLRVRARVVHVVF